MQILLGYALSVLLLHELECRSRALFLRRRWRGASPCTLRQTPCACFGALTAPILFLLSAAISWELVESYWDAQGATTGAPLVSV